MSQIRAGQLKEDLLALASLGNELATRVIADLDSGTLRRIASATRVNWLPVELNVELARVGMRHLGEAGLRAWGRASVLRSMEASLLQPILQGAIRLFGATPAGVFRTVPAAYQASYRGCGRMVVSGEAIGARRVDLIELPPVLQEPCFLHAMAGALEGIFVVCKVEGAARLVGLTGDRAEFQASWYGTAAIAGDGARGSAPASRSRRT